MISFLQSLVYPTRKPTCNTTLPLSVLSPSTFYNNIDGLRTDKGRVVLQVGFRVGCTSDWRNEIIRGWNYSSEPPWHAIINSYQIQIALCNAQRKNESSSCGGCWIDPVGYSLSIGYIPLICNYRNLWILKSSLVHAMSLEQVRQWPFC